MRVRARFELLLVRRQFPGRLFAFQEVIRGRCAGRMDTWHRGIHVELYLRRRVRLRWRQSLDVQWRHTSWAAIIVRFATMTHGVPVDARVSGHEFHFYEANGTKALGLEALVQIRIQRVHIYRQERLFSVGPPGVLVTRSFGPRLRRIYCERSASREKSRHSLLSQGDEEKLLRVRRSELLFCYEDLCAIQYRIMEDLRGRKRNVAKVQIGLGRMRARVRLLRYGLRLFDQVRAALEF